MLRLIDKVPPSEVQTLPSLKDGRTFLPSFDDGGQSYSRLIGAISSPDCENQLANLQALISELQPEVRDSGEEPLRLLKLRAAALVLRDLIGQGWIARIENGCIALYPKTAQPYESVVEAKAASRQVGMFAREDQLRDPSIRRFITSLEQPGRGSSCVPITNLIADGRTLRELLEPIAQLPKQERGTLLRQVIKPYLQLVEPDKRCELTGIKYADIWRYFRFNWSIPFNTSPGRNLFFLIRDAGQPYHPVMAIAALGNSVMQLNCRDMLFGWLPKGFMQLIEKSTISALEGLTCLQNCIQKSLAEIYIDDLPIKPEELQFPTPQTLSRLIAFRDDAALRRKIELAEFIKPKRIEFETNVTTDELLKETKTTLYQFKRSKSIAELLRARLVLNTRTVSDPLETLQNLMADEEGQIAVGIALRQARNRLSGSTMMEIVVCGGVPPYSSLLSGKLACLLMLSPAVAQIYEERYSQQVSIIASQMAGRAIFRPSKLVYLGTSSLYAVGSSQYNRVALPAGTISRQCKDVRYTPIGDTEGYGSAHLSKETKLALTVLENKSTNFKRVNNVFGEGANPKMRQLASGLDALGIAQANLLRHASPRLIYSIPLIENLERYLLEVDESPKFIISTDRSEVDAESSSKITDFWIDRWLASRLDHKPLFQQLVEFSPLKLRISKDLPRPVQQLELPFLDVIDRETRMQAPVDEKLDYIRRLYREESAFADNVKLNQLRDINISTSAAPVERVIELLIKSGASVVLTGNAGDGKTHLIRLMGQKLKNQDAYIVQDASAERLDEVVQQWADSLQTGKSSCIAINEGPLLDLIKKYRKDYRFLEEVERQLHRSISYEALDSKNADLTKKVWAVPTDAKGQVFVIDLSIRQNLSEQMVGAVLDKLTEDRWYEGCTICPAQSTCGVTYNRKALKHQKVQERVGKLLENVSVRGEQITFRELMAFCSFLIFGARSCDELIELGTSELARYYTNMFKDGDGTLFDELRKGIDPVSRTHAKVDEELWKGEFSPDAFPFEPKPIPTPLDSHQEKVTKNDADAPLKAFEALKRRWFFEHPDSDRLTPRTKAEDFFEELRDTNQTTQSRVSNLLRYLNRFLYAGEKNCPDRLRLWTQLAYSPRNKAKAMVSGRDVPSLKLFLYEPRLTPLLERCFGTQPIDHIWLGPEGKDLRFANLRIDIRLLNLLLAPYGGTTDDPECTRRIYRFNDTLANQVQPDGGDFRTVSMVEGRLGREVRIRVDLRRRRYDDLDSDRR
jgi:energy-coupling factor transporter ATP-binding protein EcfA2